MSPVEVRASQGPPKAPLGSLTVPAGTDTLPVEALAEKALGVRMVPVIFPVVASS